MLTDAARLTGAQDGVASPDDVDTAVSQGLGLRWSFMGPFQTIDLNAPNGVPAAYTAANHPMQACWTTASGTATASAPCAPSKVAAACCGTRPPPLPSTRPCASMFR